MLKIFMIFGVGLCEQCLYTAYLISVNKRQAVLSSILMLVYMSLYLFIVAYALKDTNAIGLLITYACACGVGNLITMKWENREKKNKVNNCRLYNESRKCRDCTAAYCKIRANDYEKN